MRTPYQPMFVPSVTPRPAATTVVRRAEWRAGLPMLVGAQVVLRELRMSDAPALYHLLTADDVARFITPPPASVAGFERFIASAHQMRAAGKYVCYAVTLDGSDDAIGLFQLRAQTTDFSSAEWGFALGSPYWGRGFFPDAAALVIQFAFETIGVRRLEARASVKNGRGNGALRKIGAVQEGVLRRSFQRNGDYHDQVLWSILDEDWFGLAGITSHASIH